MKLRKLIRCATAAVVASAMALSISMPALASTWNLSDYSRIEVYEGSNETNRVNYIPHAEEGAPAASDNRDDSDTVFKGKAKAGTTVTLHDNSEVTFKDAEFENSSGVPLTVGWYEGSADVKIHLEGDSSFLSNDGGIRILSGTLTIDGNGTLTINGTKTSGAINEPDSVTVAGNAGLIIKEYTHTAETDPVKVDGSNAWVKYVDAATGETYKTLGNAANVPVDNVEDYKITVTVGGKTYKVTSANCGDILGDDYTSGKLSYSDNILTGLGELPGMTIETLNAVDVELYNNDGGIVVNGNLTIDGAQNVTVVSENNNTSTAWGTVINGDANITCTNDVLLENKGAGDVVGGNGSRKKLKVTGARDVTVRGKCETSTYTVFGDAEIDCNRDITITSEYSTAVLGNLIVTKARKVKVVGNGSHGVGGDATITCSGTVVLENKASGSAVDGTLTYTPNPTKPYEIKAGTDAGDAAASEKPVKTSETGEQYNGTISKSYISIADPGHVPGDDDFDDDFTGDGSGAGGAIAAVLVGGAAVWGGYEVTTRVILHNILPEGASIPTNRGELAMLMWQNAEKPEPAAQPAFVDVADAELAQAAQWCVEQGYMTAEDGKFDPTGWTPKYKVIHIWNQAFSNK